MAFGFAFIGKIMRLFLGSLEQGYAKFPLSELQRLWELLTEMPHQYHQGMSLVRDPKPTRGGFPGVNGSACVINNVEFPLS